MSQRYATRSAGWSRRLPLAAVAVAALVGAFLLRDVATFETLARHRGALLAFRDSHYVATVAGFMAIYVGVVALSLPGATLATLTGGFLFGVFPGVLVNVVAATAGATLIFWAARAGLGKTLAVRINASDGLVRRIKAGLDGNQWSMLFLIRLVPAVPFFVANLMPALMAVPTRPYVITTFLGILPAGVVYTSVGAGLGEVFARGETPDLDVISRPEVLLPILGLCVLAAMPMALKVVRGRGGL